MLGVVTQVGFAVSRAWARNRAANRLAADRLRDQMEMQDRGSVSTLGQVTYFTDGSTDWVPFNDDAVENLSSTKPVKKETGTLPKKPDSNGECGGRFLINDYPLKASWGSQYRSGFPLPFPVSDGSVVCRKGHMG